MTIINGWIRKLKLDVIIPFEIINLIKLYYNTTSIPFIGELYTFIDEDNNIDISDGFYA